MNDGGLFSPNASVPARTRDQHSVAPPPPLAVRAAAIPGAGGAIQAVAQRARILEPPSAARILPRETGENPRAPGIARDNDQARRCVGMNVGVGSDDAELPR